jgi:hypothetical protein
MQPRRYGRGLKLALALRRATIVGAELASWLHTNHSRGVRLPIEVRLLAEAIQDDELDLKSMLTTNKNRFIVLPKVRQMIVEQNSSRVDDS